MNKNIKKTEAKTYTMPAVQVDLGKGAYIKLCKAQGIPPSFAVREYRTKARAFHREIVAVVRSSEVTSFRKRQLKTKEGKPVVYGVSYFGRIGG